MGIPHQGVEAGAVASRQGQRRARGHRQPGRRLRADGSLAAQRAIDQFTYRVVRESGAMVACMGGLDVLAFSGGNKISIAQYQRNPDTLLVRGTYIRCVLETRIITDVDGFTSCIVTEPVYSINGHKLLLPKGSKALGRYQGEGVRVDE